MDFEFRIDTPLGVFESPVKFDFYAKGKLPPKGEAHGLYILCKRLTLNRFEVLYAGETEDCWSRLKQHEIKDWTHVFHEYGMTWRSRRYWEAALILGLKPPKNVQVVRWVKSKGETPERGRQKLFSALPSFPSLSTPAR